MEIRDKMKVVVLRAEWSKLKEQGFFSMDVYQNLDWSPNDKCNFSGNVSPCSTASLNENLTRRITKRILFWLSEVRKLKVGINILGRFKGVYEIVMSIASLSSSNLSSNEDHQIEEIIVNPADVTVKRYCCPRTDCSYKVDQLGQFKKHLKRHALGKTFACPHCEYSASQSGHLSHHIKARHTGEKPFRCSQCDYSAVGSGQLKRHITAQHTEDRRYSCDFCEYRAFRAEHLRLHVRTNHTLERPYHCKECNYSAVVEAQVRDHVASKHSKEKPYACSHCSYRAPQPKLLRRHMISMHTERKPYVCSQCDYSTTNSTRFKLHVKSKHSQLADVVAEKWKNVWKIITISNWEMLLRLSKRGICRSSWERQTKEGTRWADFVKSNKIPWTYLFVYFLSI